MEKNRVQISHMNWAISCIAFLCRFHLKYWKPTIDFLPLSNHYTTPYIPWIQYALPSQVLRIVSDILENQDLVPHARAWRSPKSLRTAIQLVYNKILSSVMWIWYWFVFVFVEYSQCSWSLWIRVKICTHG